MPDRPPTYKDRAIATGVNNASGWRDLIIELADEIDKLVCKDLPTIGDNGEEAETAEITGE